MIYNNNSKKKKQNGLEFKVLILDQYFKEFESNFVDDKFKRSYRRSFINYHKVHTVDPYKLFKEAAKVYYK